MFMIEYRTIPAFRLLFRFFSQIGQFLQGNLQQFSGSVGSNLANGSAYQGSTAMAFTKDFIHFEDVSDRVSVPPLHKHGTIFKAPKRDVKRLLQQTRP